MQLNLILPDADGKSAVGGVVTLINVPSNLSEMQVAWLLNELVKSKKLKFEIQEKTN